MFSLKQTEYRDGVTEKAGILNVMLKYRMGLTLEWILLPVASFLLQRWTRSPEQLPGALCGRVRRRNRDK